MQWIGFAPTDTPEVLLFVGALPQEFAGLLKRCAAVRKERLPVHWARSGLLRERPILAIANGAGARRAYAAVAGPDLEAVCSVGFCGALDPDLRVGDVVLATHVNGAETSSLQTSGRAIYGSLASIDHVAHSTAEKRNLRLTGAIAVEMEAEGALRRTEALALPFYSIKAVTDLAEETLHCDFNRALRDDGRVRTSELAFQALMRPFTCAPELIRLGRRSALASERLGEFLAACEF